MWKSAYNFFIKKNITRHGKELSGSIIFFGCMKRITVRDMRAEIHWLNGTVQINRFQFL